MISLSYIDNRKHDIWSTRRRKEVYLVENEILNRNKSRKQDPTLTSIFEILDEHNKRLVHCEEVNNSLLQQFSDLVSMNHWLIK